MLKESLTRVGNKMDLSMHLIPLRDLEYRTLVKLIYEKSGINLGDNKQELLKTRLGKRLRALDIKTYGEYYDYATDPDNVGEMTNLINAISTNFTSFYRESQHYDFLLKTVLGEIVKNKQALHSRKIRIWCAAASSGEEPYTLALTLLEYFKNSSGWDIKLLATDISSKVLSHAYQGIYSEDNVKMVKSALLSRYFDKERQDDEIMYHVKDEVKRMIVFRRLNLMDPVFPFQGPFDFIFCRNVMIYFDLPTQENLIEKLLKYLVVGGYFFTSHSENLPQSFRDRVEIVAPATYRKIK